MILDEVLSTDQAAVNHGRAVHIESIETCINSVNRDIYRPALLRVPFLEFHVQK